MTSMTVWSGVGVLFAILCGTIQAQEPKPASKPPTLEVAADGTVTVRGTARFTDRKRDVHDKVCGSVRALLWYRDDTGQDGTGTVVEIVDGVWTATFRRPECNGQQPYQLSIREARIDDDPVILETTSLSLEDAKDFVLLLRAIPEMRVRAIDAETKKDLAEVEVFRGVSRGEWQVGALHPGPDEKLERIVESGKSPVVVPAPDEVLPHMVTTLWVRAPGFAWFPLQVEFAEGGTREAPLVRGGSVKFAIAGKVPGTGTVALRVYGSPGHDVSPLLDLSIERGAPKPLQDLAPGRYEARLEQGHWFRQPRVLARAPLEIAAGIEASVELVVEKEVVEPDRVTLRGVLMLPVGWERSGYGVSLQLEPLRGTDRLTVGRYCDDEDLLSGEKAGEYRFSFPDTVVGRYALIVHPSFYHHVVHVTKDGVSDLRIEVSEPVEIVVRVLDRDKKQPRTGLALNWHPQWPPGVLGGSLEQAVPTANSNEVRILVPTGRIVVSATEAEFEVPQTTLDVSPNLREFEVFAVARNTVMVALYEGATRIPAGWGSGWGVSLLTVDGEFTPHEVASGGGDVTLTTTTPGTYLLRVTGPDGYQPIKDRQVRVGPPPFPTIDIKVERK